MPKHAVNTSEQAKIARLFRAGNSAEAIAMHMNVDLKVVQSWHPDNVAAVRNRHRAAEVEAAEEAADEEQAVHKAKAPTRKKKAKVAKKSAANKGARDAARDKDKELAEERDRIQQEQRQGAGVEE